MDVSEAVDRRITVRAFKAQVPSAALVRELLAKASRAPSGGNLQPWRVYGLAGAPLEALKAEVAANPGGETPEYRVYPADLWEPYRSRRFQAGEDLYATLGIPREDKPARLRQFARNGELFGAPVGLFFCLDRRVGPPQWSDMGMFMQTVMLLAVEAGLDTCAQEWWSRHPAAVAKTVGLPDDQMLFSGMGLGWRDETHPINSLRTRRAPVEEWTELKGFD